MALIEDSVVVAIDQQPDAADRRVTEIFGERLVVGRFHVRIIGHLDDVEPSVLVIGCRDRVEYQGLGGEQIEAEAVLRRE